jgi:hypothetical protein
VVPPTIVSFAVFFDVVVNNITAASTTTSSATNWYVRYISICLVMDVVLHDMLLFTLVNASSIFVFHMLIEIVSNYPIVLSGAYYSSDD